MAKLNKILENIRPRPRIVEIGGESFEFHQLTLADFAEIAEKTGVDLIQLLLRVGQTNDPGQLFSSKLLQYIFYLSLKRGNNDLAKEITPGAAAEIITYGLPGEKMSELLVWILSGNQVEQAAAGGKGKSVRRTSTGSSPSRPSDISTG